MEQDEVYSNLFGFLYWRSMADRGIWKCTNCDYDWTAVVDDFGNLVQVTPFVNMRGY